MGFRVQGKIIYTILSLGFAIISEIGALASVGGIDYLFKCYIIIAFNITYSPKLRSAIIVECHHVHLFPSKDLNTLVFEQPIYPYQQRIRSMLNSYNRGVTPNSK